jgi:hypothetical protein
MGADAIGKDIVHPGRGGTIFLKAVHPAFKSFSLGVPCALSEAGGSINVHLNLLPPIRNPGCNALSLPREVNHNCAPGLPGQAVRNY